MFFIFIFFVGTAKYLCTSVWYSNVVWSLERVGPSTRKARLENPCSLIHLRRMTLGFYGYIGQNYIFAYSNSKTSKLQKKKKILKKKIWKKYYFFAALPWLLGVDILKNSCELTLCHNLVILVPFCSYGDMLIAKTKKKVGGGVGKITGKALKPPENT